jgi:intein/homing endonuclease
MPQLDTASQLNDFAMFLSYTPTWLFYQFCALPPYYNQIAFFTGNQLGKTSVLCHEKVMRVMGSHPIPEKNFLYFECENGHTYGRPAPWPGLHFFGLQDGQCFRLSENKRSETRKVPFPSDMTCSCGAKLNIHNRRANIYRLCSENLPMEKEGSGAESGEIKNRTYPELKKWLPPFLIKKDISQRNPSLKIADPNGGCVFGEGANAIQYPGHDIIFEFVSYSQVTQGTAGTQRLCVFCVAKGQRVLMSDGVWRNIEELIPGDELICETRGGHGTRQRTNKIKHIFGRGPKPVYRVKCSKGITLELTSDHKVMVPSTGKSQYMPVSELKIGDKITCRMSDFDNDDTIESWKMVLLAVVLGDGCITDKQKSAKFTCKNGKLIEEIEQQLPDFISLRKHVFKNGHSPDYWINSNRNIGKNRNEFKAFLKQIGVWGHCAGSKYIPDEVFRQSNSSIALFLRFLFATDGWASNSIGYCSTSYRLAQDVFLLLRRLKIRSTIRVRTFENGWATQYHISVNNSKDIIRFAEIVGIAGKLEQLDVLVEKSKGRVIGRSESCSFENKNKTDIFAPSDRNVRWVQVRSIEPVGEKDVYDISMETGGWDKSSKTGKQIPVARSPRNNFLIQGGAVISNCDEEPPYTFYEEQVPRLMAENGDFQLGLTPAIRTSFTFDEFFEQAEIYVRTKSICEFYKTSGEEDKSKPFEKFPTRHSYKAVFQASTYDNPTLSREVIDKTVGNYADPDTVATRLYGIHRQATGRILKDFDWKIHVIDADKYFSNSRIPLSWTHFRGIDYHPRTPWACGACSLSPTDEMYIWYAKGITPDKFTTFQIMEQFSYGCMDYQFKLNLVDPLAEATKVDLVTMLDEINRVTRELKRDDIGTGGYWQAWNTKGEFGRDQIRVRLKNARKVGRPFNNKVIENGREVNLPTIWIFRDGAHEAAESMAKWSWEQWVDQQAMTTKDDKNTPQQKYSHLNMVWECIHKHTAFRFSKHSEYRERDMGGQYFKSARA